VIVDGAVCLVTGASSGIGRAAALRLSQLGARVVAQGRDARALEAVAALTSGPVVRADLREAEEGDRVAREALEAFGRVDVLVNNAGEGWFGPFVEMELGRAAELVAVNLLGPIRLTRALLPHMLERGSGHVVNVASIAGHVGVRGESVYAATKAALIGFTESLRYELAGTGVGVSLVTPGVIDTAFFERRGTPYHRRRPRPIPPERVAEAVVRVVQRNKAEVFVPRWMAFPAWLRGTWPGLYRRLQSRFG
jgi:short-subunit dehydrogenase